MISLLFASALASVDYVLSFPEPHTHRFVVTVTAPTHGADELEFYLPVWAPGSYLVREYSRHLEGVEADGVPLQKVKKNRWVAKTNGQDEVTVSYTVYAREMTVRTNFVDRQFAMLHGAATFLEPVGQGAEPHSVRVAKSPWPDSHCALPQKGGAWRAENYDALVDAPIVLGSTDVFPFRVDDTSHLLVNVGSLRRTFDGKKATTDLEKLVEEHVAFWGDMPYPNYTFLNMVVGARGGLEHRASTVMMTYPDATRERETYVDWLDLASHEFFHTWNVKRLRPKGLGPFDYEHEVHTESLWVAEGITSYYAPILNVRAGIETPDEALAWLSKRIKTTQTTPGRNTQPLTTASFDAWTRHYRPDENSRNVAMSYYVKGAVVGWLLDAEIRRATRGEASLDTVMRRAYETFDEGYTEEDFQALTEEVAGTSLDAFFASYVRGTEPLDFGPALEWFGLAFKAKPSNDGEPPKSWIGAELSGGSTVMVRGVDRASPAWEAGLNPGDELLSIGKRRATSKIFTALEPGTSYDLVVSRRGALENLSITPIEDPTLSWKLIEDEDASKKARKRRERWLGER